MGISGKTGQSKSVLKKLIDEVGLYNYLCPHNNIMSSKEIFRWLLENVWAFCGKRNIIVN